MRKEFLRSVAGQFYSLTGGDMRGYCFVFPNRRSSLFFRRYLGECTDRPIFAPRITNINDLFSELSGLRPLDRITLLHRLYSVYREKVPGYDESFDDFIYRGEVILGDFDDIDKYMADAEGLFANIRDLKEIESRYSYLSPAQREAIASFWGVVIPCREGRKEQQFLGMWDSLYAIYTGLRTRLESRGEAYEGMIYRSVAESLKDGDQDLIRVLESWGQTVFVGLNAPNRCERTLMDTLQKIGRGDFYWDYYGDAVRDPANKSSLFMEDNVSRYPSRHPLPEDGGLCSAPPLIEAVSVPSAVGQAKYVHDILKQIVREEGSSDLFSTAVLLPDEQLLFPLLNSLPEEVRPVNVTMGYSLAHSNVSSFVSALAALQDRLRLRNGQVSFYWKDVLALLAHPFIGGTEALRDRVKVMRDRIIRENTIYPDAESLREEIPLLGLIFRDASEPGVPASESVSEYLSSILDSVAEGADSIDREFLMGYSRSLNLLHSLSIDMRKDTYFRLLRRLEASVSIPFSGEPLDGLQIMGPLEIRALDFENLIVLSVNEGTFPSRNTAASMIPYNLRRGFGLPTYEFQDSISAYHFYRSICRARRVWLLTDSRGEGLRSGEESRYIKQLEYHYRYPIRRRTVSFTVTGNSLQEVAPVPKTGEHLKRLREMTYSNSSLQMWLGCPIRFYYQYILGLEEPEDLSEGVDNAAFGTLYHFVMKRLYGPFRNRQVDRDELRRLSADSGYIASLVEEGFHDELGLKDINGRNRIAGALVARLASRTLEVDAARAAGDGVDTVVDLEERYSAPFVTPGGNRVRIQGIFDRIDRVGGQLRIVDYKTGGDHFNCREIADLFRSDTRAAGSHFFQLLLYLLILRNREKSPVTEDVDNVRLEIYYTRSLYTGGQSWRVAMKSEYEEFTQELGALMDRILDPEVPFTACEDGAACGYCPFTALCNR